jgi:hypothetical protein
LKVGNLQHQQRRIERTIEYVAAVDHVANPEYSRLQQAIEADRRSLRDLEATARVARADCETAKGILTRANYCNPCAERTQEQSYCNRAEALIDTYNKAVEQQSGLVEQLNNTPQMLAVERRATHSYIETAHRWELPWQVDFGDVPGIRDTVLVEGVDRPGFAPARIEGSTARAPDVRAMVANLEGLAGARLLEVQNERLMRHGVDLAATCANLAGGERTECELQSLWYRGKDPVSTWLQALSTQVDRQTRYAPASCVGG